MIITATQIFVKQNGEYFAGWIDLSNQMVDGEREQCAWIDRIDRLEPTGLINTIKYYLFPEKEFHAIIAKNNKICDIDGTW